MKSAPLLTLAMIAAVATGCSVEDASTDNSALSQAPNTYTFNSVFEADKSSVSHGGQTARHMLIGEMKTYIGELTDAIAKDPDTYGKPGATADGVNFFFLFDATVGGDQPFKLTTTPETLQKVWSDLSAPNLKGKIAGQDAKGQHKEWLVDGTMKGWKLWADGDKQTPEGLYNKWVGMLDDLAVAHAKGEAPKGPDGKELTKVFVTAAGHDLQQLLQKFLLGAIAFSQAADDYLDDDTDGKGLLSDNTEAYVKSEKSYPTPPWSTPGTRARATSAPRTTTTTTPTTSSPGSLRRRSTTSTPTTTAKST